MAQIPLADEAVGIQHSVPAGHNIPGDLPDVGTLGEPTWNKDRQVLIHVEPVGAGGGGFFLPSEDLLLASNHAFCTHVQIFSSAGFSWTVNVTSGLGDGTGLDGDNPDKDQGIASGTDNAHVPVMRELLPGQGVRVSTSGATGRVFAIAHFANVVGQGGRLI